jgi:hypothetical protein
LVIVTVLNAYPGLQSRLIDFAASVDVKRRVAPERAQEAIGFVLQKQWGSNFLALSASRQGRRMRQVVVYTYESIFLFAKLQLLRVILEIHLYPMIDRVSRIRSDLGQRMK